MKKLEELSNEFKQIEQDWYKEIATIDTKAKLNRFIDKVMYGYEHDFGTYIRALTVVIKAVVKVHGSRLSNMQVDFLMFNVLREVFNKKDPIAIKLVQFQWLMYPQTVYKCDFFITKEAHNKIIEYAKELLVANQKAVKEVRDHWQKLANGWLPDFVKVYEDSGEA